MNRKKLFIVLVGLLLMAVTIVTNKSQADSLTSVSVTLSNPRLSFRGALGAGNTLGSSIVIINTTAGDYPSTSSAQLVQGDVLLIGETSSLGSYTVASTSSLSTLSITAGLAAGDIEAADDAISSQSATQTVRLTTANAIANGRFRVLVPALTDDGAANDGIPDGGYFDMGAAVPTVTCPSTATAVYDFVAGVASASAQTIDSVDYHVFECAYSGTGAVGTAFNTGSDMIVINSLINPAPESAHHTGVADTHNIVVQHLDSSFTVIDTTTVGIGVIEAVKVTASVPAQITFKVIGVAKGVSACGTATDVMTTAAAVPFGDVPLDAFTDAAQTLTVSTNATNGYSVTATANDQLGRSGGACAGDPTAASNPNCIPDAAGDGAVMSHTAYDAWDLNATKGFAYSLYDSNNSISNGSAEAFNYNENSGACSGASFCSKQFADTEDSEVAQAIFGSNAVADNENLYACYRIIPAATTAAGNYENFITYTATATF
jgi:hypothetical protein